MSPDTRKVLDEVWESSAAPAPDANETERILAEATMVVHDLAGMRVGSNLRELLNGLCAKVRELQGERDALAQGEYRGNSVQHWHAKATAYGDIVHGISPKLGRQDGETLAQAADRLVAERDAAQGEALRLRAVLELIATGKRPDGTYNRCREACEQLANLALTAHQPAKGQE